MRESGTTPPQASTQKSAAALVGRFFGRGYLLLHRLLKDEILLRRYNALLPDSQRQGGDRARLILITVTLAVVALQCVGFYLLATGFATRGERTPVDLVSMMIRARRLPTLEEVVYLPLLCGFLISVVVPHLITYAVFVRRRSAHARFIDVVTAAGVQDDEKSLTKIWYYPGRLAVLPLLRSGEEMLKERPLWNRAGFQPSLDFKELPGNVFLFVSKKQKSSTSTMLYDRYEEWTTLMTDRLKRGNWHLGEYVDKETYKWKDMNDYSTIAFIGMTGSGKTEAMRTSLAAVKIMHPDLRLIIYDPKAASDWDAFGPMTETGRILKTPDDGNMGFFYAKAVLESRRDYFQEKGYKNITEWEQAEGVVVPPIVVVVDEYPQFNKAINFDFNYKKPTTPAGILFEIMTMGRSYGVWFSLGSQFGLGEHVPTEVNKNMKVHVCLRVGSPGESAAWVETDDAFRLGKGKTLPNGEDDPQSGYAYIDAAKEFVRFWYADNTMLYHEFLKYRVPTMEGCAHAPSKRLSVPKFVMKKIDGLKSVGKDESHLPRYERECFDAHARARVTFEAGVSRLEAECAATPIRTLKPLAVSWTPGEDGPTYAERAYRDAIARLGISHRARSIFPAGSSPSRPAAAPLIQDLGGGLDPRPSLGAASTPAAKAAPAPRAAPDIKRPSMDDIFKSLAGDDDRPAREKK